MSELPNAEWKPSDELNGIPLGTAEEERARAKLWMDTAAQHCRNEEYWRQRATKSEERSMVFRSQAQDLRRAAVYGSSVAMHLCPSSHIDKARAVVQWAEQVADMASCAYYDVHNERPADGQFPCDTCKSFPCGEFTECSSHGFERFTENQVVHEPQPKPTTPCDACTGPSPSVCTECSESNFDRYQGPALEKSKLDG